MWCAGRLGKCPKDELFRFHLTCLYCRWRRAYLGKWTKPKYWIEYTYRSLYKIEYLQRVTRGGFEYTARNGAPLKVISYSNVLIDPRGRFLKLRIAAILTIDKLMKLTGIGKPLVEACEFLANYP